MELHGVVDLCWVTAWKSGKNGWLWMALNESHSDTSCWKPSTASQEGTLLTVFGWSRVHSRAQKATAKAAERQLEEVPSEEGMKDCLTWTV